MDRFNNWWQQYKEGKKGNTIVNIEDHLSSKAISNHPTIINTNTTNNTNGLKEHKEHRWGPHLFYLGSGGKKRCRTRTCKPKGKPAKSRTSSSSSSRMRRSSAHRNRK